MKCISVEDEMPSFNKAAYFTYCDDGKIYKDIWYDTQKKEWMINYPMDFYGVFEGAVTHWMPFPKPPEE